MSEEEITKYIKDETENETDTYHWFDDTPKNKVRLQIEESINAHQGLLDLYTNAKEEINKLNNVIDRMAEKINQAYFDESNMWLWFEKNIRPKKEDGKYDFKDLGTRKERIKEYFMKEDK